jgi:hypothetical protein
MITGGSLLAGWMCFCGVLLDGQNVVWKQMSVVFLRCKGGWYGSAVLYWEDESGGVGEGAAGKRFRNG